MGVYARKRGLSSREFFFRAMCIRDEVVRVVHKERLVPKSYRFTFAVPMCETARSMIANIERADAFYPNSSWAVIERKKYLALAIADANTLYDDLACLVEVRGGAKKNPDGSEEPGRSGIDLNEMRELLTLLDGEIGLLQAAKNGVKLIGGESEEDRLRAAEEEAQRLRDLILMRGDGRV
ncbi:hypothetical protein LI088_04100 [Adlercreutzia equolifaciens]|uniref:hypothetical protein n=1 Tax=Adlercreutzia TaxID=447020 RepID=UPI001928C938|nr:MULTISPECIES: hypothetical protein [Adlercreutzia]MCB6760052.1 hypothetical protein [Adlercreutzia equolifaciens]MCB6975729.1 hypothetical protein [Adlercreutzia equolifaciens]MCQ5070791.1 hypothetical protein [Adlercreutzia sp. DFI.6.23]MDE8683873.1 hypothetical protein [Adlercreutzia rubneri]